MLILFLNFWGWGGTANLSLAFARLGYRSGILDTDIFGPSIPTLFDLTGEPRLSSSKSLSLSPSPSYACMTNLANLVAPPPLFSLSYVS